MIIDRIKELCKEKGVTFGQLLRRSNLSVNAYDWAHRTKEPSFRSICQICEGLDISLSEFFGGLHGKKLTGEQCDFIRKWRSLSRREQVMIRHAMDAFTTIKRNAKL